jgi:hypothetical protein
MTKDDLLKLADSILSQPVTTEIRFEPGRGVENLQTIIREWKQFTQFEGPSLTVNGYCGHEDADGKLCFFPHGHEGEHE